MNENRIAVSIIIPVYNAERYLIECMESVVGQKLKEIEIICIDDGSTDSSPRILDAYAVKDTRVKVVHKYNTGYGHSMNVGFNMARGKYIGIVEADDYIDLHMMGDLYRDAEKWDVDIIKADFQIFTGSANNRKYTYCRLLEDKSVYDKVLNPKIDREALDAYMTSWSGIYRRGFIEDKQICHNESPGASYQDNGFWFQVFTQAERVYFVNKPYYYLRRDNPGSSVYDKTKIYSMHDEFIFIKEFVCKNEFIKNNFRDIFFRNRDWGLNGTLKRIEPQFRQEVLHRYAEDYRQEIEEGFLQEKYVSPGRWKEIQEMVADPDIYYWNHWGITEQKLQILRGSTKKILLYGNGNYARKNLDRLEEYQIPVAGVIVSELKNEKPVRENMPIFEISQLDGKESDYIIIPSVSEKYMQEILDIMKSKGFENIVFLSV